MAGELAERALQLECERGDPLRELVLVLKNALNEGGVLETGSDEDDDE